MDVNEKGKVISHKIAETVIRVDERMCYTDVKNILEDTDEVAKKRYEALIPMFFLMKELSGILRSRRHTRGSIDFDFPESKIILNAAGRAIDVQPYEANVATRIIEDFMLLANETVAQEYCTGDYPFVYRTHENPDPEKIESLLMLLHNEGVNIQKSGQEITPGEIQEILESIEGMPNEAQISRLTLRTMKQAKYTTECSGHFGLAAKYYCHFTSPIRRYPDLQIHRIIHDRLRGRLVREGRTEHYKEILDEVARQSSVCERRADEAERESDKLKKAEYMSYHLGEEYEGIISGVTGWGLYVELPNTVEGLIHINTLRDDYYVFDQDGMKLIANNKKAFHDYFIEDTYEAGIALAGTEVKSLRSGKCSIKEAFVRVENGEVYVYGMHITPYEKGNIFNKDPLRVRKLLLHRYEINKIEAKLKEKGLTLVPLKVYFKDSLVKIEIGMARGKKLYDKRQDIAKKDQRREAERDFKVKNLY